MIRYKTYCPANDEEAANGNCKIDRPRLKIRKLQRRTPAQCGIISYNSLSINIMINPPVGSSNLSRSAQWIANKVMFDTKPVTPDKL